MHTTTLKDTSLQKVVLEITKNKSLGLLLVLISQTHSVPQHDYKNYLYHYIVKVHDEQAYAQIREKEKENIRFLLKLWLRELTNRIFTKTVISPEDNVVIDKIINEVVKKKKSLLSQYPDDDIKDQFLQEFSQSISKSQLKKNLKSMITHILSDTNLLNNYKKDIMNHIALMTHDQDAISLLACHGITISNTTPLPSTPLSKEIKRLYQDVMGVKYSLFHQRIITQFPKGHIVNTISDMIYDAHTKLHKKENHMERFLKGTYPWYSIITNIKKMITNSLFVKQRLEKERVHLNKIKFAFTKSIHYGDTAIFFEELKKIKHNTVNYWNPLHINTSLLIKSLTNLESQAEHKSIKDFVTDIQHYDNIKPYTENTKPNSIQPTTINVQPKKKKGIKRFMEKISIKNILQHSSKTREMSDVDITDNISSPSLSILTLSSTDSHTTQPKLYQESRTQHFLAR